MQNYGAIREFKSYKGYCDFFENMWAAFPIILHIAAGSTKKGSSRRNCPAKVAHGHRLMATTSAAE